MKTKLFTLLLAVAASMGTMCATITVRLNPQSCSSWSTVRLWAWTSENGVETNLFDAWPGIIVNADEDGWYSYTFDNTITKVNIIWTDGNNQTIDITDVTESTCYALESTTGTYMQGADVRIVDCPMGETPNPDNAEPNQGNSSMPTDIQEYTQDGIVRETQLSIPMTYLAFQIGCSASSSIGVDILSPSGTNYTIIGTSYTNWGANTFQKYQYFNPVSWCYSITTIQNGYAFFDLQSIEQGTWTFRHIQSRAGEWYYYHSAQTIAETIVDTATIFQDCNQNGINAIIAQKNGVNGHEYVDLGLPSGLLWATCNVGASTPEQVGGYYAWGETETKTSYINETYIYTNNQITLNDISTTQYDAARVNWGGEWRMPSRNEVAELTANCSRKDTTINGTQGLILRGSNGNYIFVPRSGHKEANGVIEEPQGVGFWTSSANGSSTAYRAWEWSYISYSWRREGFPIRPVCSKGATGQSTASTLPDYTLTLNATGCETSNTFVCADGQEVTIKAIPQEHYHFVQWSDGDQNATRIIVVTSDTTFTAEFAINQYTVEVLSENNEAGLVTGSGTFEALAEVTIMAAVCKDGYQWDRWSDGITLAGRKITLTSDTTLTAYFMTIPEEHCLEVGVNDESLGQADILIQAVPNDGAIFVMWSDGNTTNPRVVTNSDIATYTAIFATTPTDIPGLSNTNVSAHKIMSEGQIFILRGDKTYTLTGQEVK